jgi:transposase-like protein
MGSDREAVWAQRRELVTRWEQSGLSMAEFCRREGMPYWQLLSWRKRIAQLDESASGFAELVVKASADECEEQRGTSVEEENATAASHRALLEIALPGGACVRVFGGVDAVLLRDAVQAARA